MKRTHSLSLLFLIFIFFLIDFSYEASPKHKKNLPNNKMDSKTKIRERRYKKNISGRKLEDDDDFEPEMTFAPLKIYIDTAEFNYTFSEGTETGLNIDDFIIAMNGAKDILEEFLEINTDTRVQIDLSSIYEETDYTAYFEENYGITHWTTYLNDGIITLEENYGIK